MSAEVALQNGVTFANDRPFVLIGGMNVIEGDDIVMQVAASFVSNVLYLRIDNHAQLALVGRAESLLAPGEVYFDGVGMLPDRREPSTLWLDRHAILEMLHEGRSSALYRTFADTPPKIIIWTYRMDAVAPLVDPLIRDSYVKVAPNIRMAGISLRRGQPATFLVPLAGRYALYDLRGDPVQGRVDVGGSTQAQVDLPKGRATVTLLSGPPEALLVPQGRYAGKFATGADDKTLFDHVYD